MLTGSIISIGTVTMHLIEKWSLVDSVYFSVVSLTTVGYGDLTPKTDLGKLFVSTYLIIGIALMAALIDNVLRSAFARRIIHQTDKKND